ncbi:MAG: cell division protein ZapE [Alphaproteobacteria bacterium]
MNPLPHPIWYDKALATGRLKPDTPQAHAAVVLEEVRQSVLAGRKPQGVYLHGPVGRGKSAVMALFLEAVKEDKLPFRRVHFHAFMEEVHARMHTVKPMAGQDPLGLVAADIIGHARLFAFDEFYVTNIADAMLLGRLFQFLFKLNVTIIATSNWPVAELFQGGINRDRFVPFMKLIGTHMQAVAVDGGQDYRRLNSGHSPNLPLWFVGTGAVGEAELWLLEQEKKYGKHPLARYPFSQLCGQAVGRDAYLALAEKLHTLVLTDIPILPDTQADTALRFVALVDIFYEHHRRLICTATALPEAICTAGDAAFAYQRTASRLREMQGW